MSAPPGFDAKESLLPDVGGSIHVMRGGSYSHSGGYDSEDLKTLTEYGLQPGGIIAAKVDEPTKQAFLDQLSSCGRNSGNSAILKKSCWAVVAVTRALIEYDMGKESSVNLGEDTDGLHQNLGEDTDGLHQNRPQRNYRGLSQQPPHLRPTEPRPPIKREPVIGTLLETPNPFLRGKTALQNLQEKSGLGPKNNIEFPQPGIGPGVPPNPFLRGKTALQNLEEKSGLQPGNNAEFPQPGIGPGVPPNPFLRGKTALQNLEEKSGLQPGNNAEFPQPGIGPGVPPKPIDPELSKNSNIENINSVKDSVLKINTRKNKPFYTNYKLNRPTRIYGKTPKNVTKRLSYEMSKKKGGKKNKRS